MSTISDLGIVPLIPQSSGGRRERLLTAADLAALPAELPSGPVLYELDNGRLIIMAPPGDIHGCVEANCVGEFRAQGQKRGLGKVRSGEVGIVLWRNPDRVVGADAVFIANASLPVRRSPEGYLETIPDLVLEIMSKNDTWAAVRKKVEDYLKAGVRVVWVADPNSRSVTAFRPGHEAVYLEKDVLTVEDIIPGFQMTVVEVFEE
jgi:Uma2 family endonuclease